MRKPKVTSVNIQLEDQPLRIYKDTLEAAISSLSYPDQQTHLGMLRRSDFGSLLEWCDTVEPQKYGSATDYFVECHVQSLIKKYPFSPSECPGLDPEAMAVKKFLASEHRCKRVNQKRRAMRNSMRIDPYAQQWEYARDYIRRVLGAIPNTEAIYDLCDYTGGASVGVHGNKTNIARKILSEHWSCTPTALFHAKRALWNNIHTRDCILPGTIKCYDTEQFSEIVKTRAQLISYNMISFVPKTAKTHRSIAVEPLLNGFVQKGVDEYMRRRLKKRTGIDLSNQSVNQAMSKLGSMGGFNPYCTIDLAAASDSLSIEVVKLLLPSEWFEFLCEIRAPRYKLSSSDETIRYEKFCSMGNGFCFPLQTLLYAAICYSASRTFGDRHQDFTVYGDDIIVRQNVALFVIELLRELGFRTNVDKTFIHGPFRESCGSDWWQGQDVRPVHFDKPLTDIREVFALHNSLLRSPIMENISHEMRSVLKSKVPPQWRFLRPGREPGDNAFSVPLDEAMTSPHVKWVTGGREVSQSWQWHELRSSAVADPGIRTLNVEEHATALLLAAMRGSSSQNPFPLRYETTLNVKRVARPFWEAYDKDDVRFAGLTPGMTVKSVRALVGSQ